MESYILVLTLRGAERTESPQTVLAAFRKLGAIDDFQKVIEKDVTTYTVYITMVNAAHMEVLSRCADTEKPLKLLYNFPWFWHVDVLHMRRGALDVVKDEAEILVDDGMESSEDGALGGA